MSVVNFPGIGDNNSASNKYILTQDQLTEFMNDFMNWLTTLEAKFLASSPESFIKSLKVWPLDLSTWGEGGTVNDNTIKYGYQYTTLSTDAKKITNDYHCNQVIGIFNVPKQFTGKYDYVNYNCNVELFLPYYGLVNLDPREVFDHTIKIEYIINLATGTATIVISNVNHNRVIATYETSMAVNIPWTGPIASQELVGKAIGAVGAVVGLGVGAAMGGGSAAISGGSVAKTITTSNNVRKQVRTQQDRFGNQEVYNTNTISTDNTQETNRTTRNIKPATDYGKEISNFLTGGSHSQSSTSGGGLSWFYLQQVPYIIITKPVISEPTDYNIIYGRPSNKSASLASLKGSGFTQISDCRLKSNGIATDAELNEIYEHLQGGIIL